MIYANTGNDGQTTGDSQKATGNDRKAAGDNQKPTGDSQVAIGSHQIATGDIRVSTDRGIMHIQLHRPERKNALSLAMYQQLGDALRAGDADSKVRVILISGAEGTFTSGNDLDDFANYQSNQSQSAIVQSTITQSPGSVSTNSQSTVTQLTNSQSGDHSLTNNSLSDNSLSDHSSADNPSGDHSSANNPSGKNTSVDSQGKLGPEADPTLHFMRALLDCDKPVIAAVQGPAVGIGTTLLLHCDLVYAGDSAYFQLPFAKLGLCPEFASSVLLPRLMGHQRAAELLYFSEPFSAEVARDLGLVNQVFPDHELPAAAMEKCRLLAQQPASGLRATKQLLKHDLRQQAPAILSRETELFLNGLHSPEFAEALTAFKKPRPNPSTS